jgi:hypothetical protein
MKYVNLPYITNLLCFVIQAPGLGVGFESSVLGIWVEYSTTGLPGHSQSGKHDWKCSEECNALAYFVVLGRS